MEISQKLKEYFSTNKIFFTNLLIIEVVSHIFYKVSFENFLLRDFEINKKVYSESLDFYRTELESPFNTILVNLFQIKDPDVYTLVIYIIFQITLVFICKNLSFLGEYSTLFLFGGWLVTISWWIGFVENISVLLIILYFKNYLLGNFNRFYLYMFLLGINHFGIAIFSTLIFLILINYEKFYQILGTTLASFIVLRLYLKFVVNFGGRGRIRFIFNNNTLDSGTDFVANALKEFLWSGFMGLIFILVFMLISSKYEYVIKYTASILFATIGAAITTDSTRIFSIILIPLIIHLLLEFRDHEFSNNLNKKIILVSVIISNLLIGERFVHGQVWKTSPNQDMESVYNFFARIVNTLMKDIWV
ncbi:MAG: hypothetical protein CMF94_05535 [Candidatus Marinimicrobia bacterium]|nr:hypothetical protein [Candidatus Neomarinimicrobiota bacterium]